MKIQKNIIIISLLVNILINTSCSYSTSEQGTEVLPLSKAAKILGPKSRKGDSAVGIVEIDGKRPGKWYMNINQQKEYTLRPGKRVLKLAMIQLGARAKSTQKVEADLEAGKTYALKANKKMLGRGGKGIWLPTVVEQSSKRVVSRNITMRDALQKIINSGN